MIPEVFRPRRSRELHDGYLSLAAKYDVSLHAVQWHAQREAWGDERRVFWRKVSGKLVEKYAIRAVDLLMERNDEQLRLNDRLRYAMNSRLFAKEGLATQLRPKVSIVDVMRAISGFGEVYRFDRLVLGADNMPAPTQRDRFDEMSEAELMAELDRVIKSRLVNLSPEKKEEYIAILIGTAN
jgi:hypothetical protein